MTFLEFLFIFFVLLGSKILLGMVVVYMLLPTERECAICDAELLTVAVSGPARLLLAVLRLERRWCMECRRDSLARRSRLREVRAGTALPVPQRRVG
jgi:hypothetical protein